jgi:hypothetical protein
MVIEDIDIFLWGGEVIEYVGLLHNSIPIFHS